jgi:hypothetical protein
MTPASSLVTDRGVRRRLLASLDAEARVSAAARRATDLAREEPAIATVLRRIADESDARRRELAEKVADLRAAPDEPTGATPPDERTASGEAATGVSSILGSLASTLFEAALRHEEAFAAGRLRFPVETDTLLAGHMKACVAAAIELRALVPAAVARELWAEGVYCTCGCPMCSLGACGCVRATLDTAAAAWEATPAVLGPGLPLFNPPRPGSPLAETGAQAGDRILAADGTPLTANQDLQAIIRQHEVGDQVNIEIESGSGDRRTVTVTRVA